FLRLHRVVLFLPVAEAIVQRLEYLERLDVGLRLAGIATPRSEGHLHRHTGRLGSFLDGQVAGQHDHIGDAGAGVGGDLLVYRQHLGQARRLIALPVLLRREADARAIGAATLVRVAEGPRAVPGGADPLGNRQTAGGDARLDRGDVVVAAAGRHRVLPDQVFGRYVRADIAGLGPHVTVGQLEPGAGKHL